MLGDPLKRSRFFTAILVGLLFFQWCEGTQLYGASANDSVSKKRQFVKVFLQAEKGDSAQAVQGSGSVNLPGNGRFLCYHR